MRIRWCKALLLHLALLALLPACSSIQTNEPDDPARVQLYENRNSVLSGFANWNMSGRLAVSNQKDGGSGNFSWSRSAHSNRMDFHGALGRGAWRLLAQADGAVLELADGTIHRANSIDQLIQNQVGWEIPVESLAWWIRGLASPGDYQQRALDEEGNLAELLQNGWAIEYGKYRIFEGVSLPVRMTARQADWKIKLAIREWGLEVDEDSRE